MGGGSVPFPGEISPKKKKKKLMKNEAILQGKYCQK